jgi:hypothetical protein
LPTTLAATEGLPPLPSVFAPVMLREGGDAFARAVELAPAEGEGFSPARGAGTLVWVRAYARAEAAVVLEPDRAAGPAKLAFHAACNALADALAAVSPPELPIRFRWPGTLLVNGGVCGTVRYAHPPVGHDDEIPEWLVVGFEARIAWPEGMEPGSNPGETSLQEEGFDDLTPALLTHGWARHLMAGLDEWQARGPRRVAERYLARLEDEAESGAKRGIAPESGALVIERDGRRETRELP